MPSHERTAIPALLVAALACTTGPDPGRTPGGGPGGAAVRNGIGYAADVRVMESFPVQLTGVVTVTNRTDSTRTVTFPDGCVALLRAYDGEERVWDQASDRACTMALVPVRLTPGNSKNILTPTASAAEVLGADRPDGAYRIAAYLRPGGEVVELNAGSVELAVPR